MTDSNLQSYLMDNPRMVGVLFTLTLLLATAGNSSAAIAATFSGP
ncbi:DUF7503 family protein [Halarchaeum sp. P4]